MSDPTSGWDFSRYSGSGVGGPPAVSEVSAPSNPGAAGGFSTAAPTSASGEASSAASTFGAVGASAAAGSTADSASSPIGWLIGGVVVAALAGAAALLVGTEPLPAFAAWAFAGPVAIGLLAVYLLLDTRRRARPLYSPPTWAPWLYRGGLVVVLLAVIACSARIALWAGRVWQL